jgi:LPXTG-motif cell wall-anchored protein
MEPPRRANVSIVIEPAKETSPEPAKSTAITHRQVASGVAVLLVLIFAVLNLQDVTMHWIVGTTHTPLIVLVGVCVLIGVAIGFLLARRRTRTPARRRSHES